MDADEAGSATEEAKHSNDGTTEEKSSGMKL
jgi:hypothetical protein